ncbi:MAG TPA: protein kinase [Trichormus sp.]|jgi:serine/threonine-protein kinase
MTNDNSLGGTANKATEANLLEPDVSGPQLIRDWQCSTCQAQLPVTTLVCPNDGTANLDAMTDSLRHSIRNYELLRVLGAGGMGTVFEAKHLVLHTNVAVKMINTSQLNDRVLLRFQREAQTANKLKHPNLVGVTDCGITKDGAPYLVMDLIEGPSLKDLLHQKGSLPVDDALNLVMQICEGMTFAHERGILHRDLKPANILLTKQADNSYQVKITDFGIAKLLGSDEGTQLTRTGEVCGSPQYMSPEHTSSRATDARADVYSIGCILYELLTGAPPYSGNSVIETLYKHVNERIPTLEEGSLGKNFSPQLEEIVAKALAKDPDNRHASAKEYAEAIARFQSGIGLRKASSPTTKSTKAASTNAIVLSILIAGIVIAGAIAMTWHGNTPTSQPSEKTAEPTLPKPQEEEASEPDPALMFDRRSLISQSRTPEIILDEQHVSDSELTALMERKDVIKLSLGKNPNITDAGVAYFTHLPLSELYLRATRISDKGIAQIAGSLKNLEVLDLSQMDISDNAIRSLSSLKKLKSLTLRSDHSLTGKSVPFLADLPSLTTLSLYQDEKLATATEKDWNLLAKRLTLEQLNLEEVPITPKSSYALANIRSLKSLNLKGTQVDDSTVEKLSSLNNLSSLDLSETDVSDRAIKTLCKYPNLTDLQLGMLRRSDINGLKELKHMPRLTVLSLYAASLTARDIDQIAQLTNLTALYLYNNTHSRLRANQIDNDAVAKLHNLHKLRLLDLSNTLVNDGAIPTLVKLNLQELKLTGTCLSDAGLHQLAAMKSLTALSIQNCGHLTPQAIEHFREDRPDCSLAIDRQKNH